MRVTWVNQAFGDYRLPVYASLDRLLCGGLQVIYSATRTHPRVQKKVVQLLGSRAIGLPGERLLFTAGRPDSGFSNRHLEIPYQPRLASAIAATRPNVVIGEGFAKWTAAALFHRTLHGTPLVVSYQRTEHTERHSQWFRRAYRRMALRFVDVICCNGRLSAEYARRLGMPPDRIITGASAAEGDQLASRCAAITESQRAILKSRHGLAGRVFLYVGRLVKLKGLDHLLEAWARVGWGSELPDASLLLIGDGPERGSLSAMIDRLGLQNVRMLGAVDYDSLPPYYALADVFVIPTLEDNWSLVVPEAMTCGLPILSSIYNGCWPELVHDGINGFTFDPLDTTDLVRRLAFFGTHPECIIPMGQASRRIVAAFSPDRAAQSFLTACRQAISRRRRLAACG
ncbi:MAG: glycosyltransferase family 4 protein [Planctomycetes bacterium]|nr:glycosyltransferase family 4 protein [Planctomycetota bacterium]